VETCGHSSPRLINELLAAARAVAAGDATAGPLPLELRRALRLAGEKDLARAAALDFVAEAIGTLAGDDALGPGTVRSLVRRFARQHGMKEETVAYRLFVGAAARIHRAQLPPADAAAAVLTLLAELAPVTAVSLWHVGRSGRTTCIAGSGRGPRGSALRAAARAALDGVVELPDDLEIASVHRWDAPHAVLVARRAGPDTALAADFLAEAATVLAPVLERDALFALGSWREQKVASSAERRLARVAFDLHDGPLQELCVFADDLRLVRGQVDGVVDPQLRDRVRGRFADLEARMESLDTALRQLVASLRSSTALECVLEDAVRAEVDGLRRVNEIATVVGFEGDLTRLTNSQRIVVFRVVQEALANVRKHSGATHVSVTVRSARRHLTVVVADDGCGFDVEQTVENVRRRNRFGLAGVVERVQLLGGDVRISAEPGAGTTIEATIPHWSPIDGTPSSSPYAAAV
jgi:signal transduction histidine kinase